MRNMRDWIALGIVVVGVGSFVFAAILMLFFNDNRCGIEGCNERTYYEEPYCVEHMYELDMYDTGYEYETVTRKPTATPTPTKAERYSGKTSNKHSSHGNPHASYDEGYEDVYEDDDYDWDRYYKDPDYADGVDDAMEDCDW